MNDTLNLTPETKRQIALAALEEMYNERFESVNSVLKRVGIDAEFDADDLDAATDFSARHATSAEARKAILALYKVFFAEILLIQTTERLRARRQQDEAKTDTTQVPES